MPQIEVVSPFILTLGNGEKKHYKPGKYDVSDEIANHTYTKAHLKGSEAAAMPQHPHEGSTEPSGLVPEKPIEETPAPAEPAPAPAVEPAESALNLPPFEGGIKTKKAHI